MVKRMEAETKSPGGIIIPEAAQKKSEKCSVVAVGPGKVLDNGTLVPMDVKVGDVVLIPQWKGSEVKVDGQDLLILKQDDVLAVYEG